MYIVIMPWLMKMMPLIVQPLLLQLQCLLRLRSPAHHMLSISSNMISIYSGLEVVNLYKSIIMCFMLPLIYTQEIFIRSHILKLL